MQRAREYICEIRGRRHRRTWGNDEDDGSTSTRSIVSVATPQQPEQTDRRRFPVAFFEGILPYRRNMLVNDIVAGVTLAALAIPEVMGYTQIAGTPVITGLYTILIPAIAFAVFGSSRHLVVGGDSATAAILYAGIAGLGVSGLQPNSSEWLAYASLAALITAGLLMLARVARLGFLADFISRRCSSDSSPASASKSRSVSSTGCRRPGTRRRGRQGQRHDDQVLGHTRRDSERGRSRPLR